MNLPPLVSVLIPAYKSRYLATALESVLAQTYPNIEVVICDDSTGPEIEALARDFGERQSRIPIRYSRNEKRLWETTNIAKCLRLAEGEYVKFLYDDDVLRADCIETLVAALEANPDVALASARRRRVNEKGEPIADILATAYPFTGNVLIDGPDLVSFLADYTINFIGEPSSVLCRREDILEFRSALTTLNGVRIRWVGDLAIYVKLLRKGRLAFFSEPLSDFRVSAEQFSQLGRDQPGIGNQGHEDFRRTLRELGWVREGVDNQKVRVAPLDAPERVAEYDLIAALARAYRRTQSEQTFQNWLYARVPTPVQKRLIDQYLEAGSGPRLAVVLLGDTHDFDRLKVTLDSLSLCAAFYPNHEVIVVGDAVLAPLTAGQTIRHVPPHAEGLAATLNGILADCEAPWMMLAQAGDEFMPAGLMMAGLELANSPACRALYPDEIHRQAAGGLGVALRPDFNLDMLLSFPASLARHCLFNRAALHEIGGFEARFEQALEFGTLLRLVESGGLAGLGHLSEPLVIADAPVLGDAPAERQAIEAHLHARGYASATVASARPGLYEVNYGHAEPGTVSILVQVGQDLARLQHCVESILGGTRHAAYEVLLVAAEASLDEATRQWLAGIEAMGEAQLRVARSPGSNLSQALNQAAGLALGDYLVLLDGECAVLHEDWLAQLLNHAQRPEVGAVGALLLSAEGKVRHAGLLLGLQGPAGRPFEGESLEAGGYMHRLQIDQDYSAVSGECLMISRALFEALGGLDEGELGQHWRDVDLCLKVREAGYLCVWTPRARLLQRGGVPGPRSPAEQDLLYAKWLAVLARDPAYNPNFSLQAKGGFRLADIQLSWRPLMAWRPLPVVLAHPADEFGCGHYRVIRPFSAMREAGLVDGALSIGLMHVADLERYDPDVILLQRQIGEDRLDAMRRMKAFSRALKVYELDDYLPNLPLKSAHRAHMPKDIVKSLRRGMGYVDRFVVSTAPLAEAFAGFHQDIRVVENRLPVEWWKGLSAQRRTGSKPRVGWAGGGSHTGDLELVADVVRELAGEVDWVFLGMCPDSLRPFVKEFHAGVHIDRYPQALASLNLDLAIAPLEQHLFNECKSNLRLLEYGACGFPVVCTDIRCYQGDLPVTRVRNRFRDWVEAIRMHLADLDETARMGDRLREAVLRDWMLEGQHLVAWRAAWSA